MGGWRQLAVQQVAAAVHRGVHDSVMAMRMRLGCAGAPASVDCLPLSRGGQLGRCNPNAGGRPNAHVTQGGVSRHIAHPHPAHGGSLCQGAQGNRVMHAWQRHAWQRGSRCRRLRRRRQAPARRPAPAFGADQFYTPLPQRAHMGRKLKQAGGKERCCGSASAQAGPGAHGKRLISYAERLQVIESYSRKHLACGAGR